MSSGSAQVVQLDPRDDLPVWAEAARGVVMGRRRCSPHEAGIWLRWLAAAAGVELYRIANQMIGVETREALLALLPPS